MKKGEFVADIIILGAGLTGLSAAFHLEQLNVLDYQIFEKNDRPGGLLQSVSCDGFTFDHTGHLLHISDDYFRAFLNSLADLESNFLFVQRRSAIFSHNTLTDYPFQMNLYGLPLPVIAECLEGFIKRSSKLRNPGTFHDWVMKHFGKGIGKHFFFPYNSKLLAYDLKKIHPSWTGRFVPSTTLEALIQGALQNKPLEGVGYNSSFYYPKQGGIEFIIHRLLKRINAHVQTSHTVVEIDMHAKMVTFSNGRQERFKKLISTLPLNTLLNLLKEPSNSTLKKGAQNLECNSVINLNLAFSQKLDNDKHWIYTPEKEFPFYRLGFWNNVCQSSVPPQHTAAYVEMSYLPGTKTDLQLRRLIDQGRKKTLDFFGLSSADIVLEKILHLQHAYVIYNNWREKNLNNVLNQLKNNNIHSVGRFGEWKYSSMQDAVLDGKNVAQQIASHLNIQQIVPIQSYTQGTYSLIGDKIKQKEHNP